MATQILSPVKRRNITVEEFTIIVYRQTSSCTFELRLIPKFQKVNQMRQMRK